MFKEIMFIVLLGAALSSAMPTEANTIKPDQLISDEKQNFPSMANLGEDLESADDVHKQLGPNGQTEVGASEDLKGSETFGFGYYPRYYVGWGGYSPYHGYGYGWGWRRPIYYY